MASSISVSGLSVRHGGLPVLRGIDLEIAAGEVTGLLGPSGSGKTTLLRTIVGLHRFRAGSVQVLGRPAGHPRLRAEIGYITQSPSAVWTNLAVVAAIAVAALTLGAATLRRRST